MILGNEARSQFLLELHVLCRGFLLQWGAVEAAEEIHHTGSAGSGHGEAKRRRTDPGRGPVSGGGFPGNRRSAGHGQPRVPGISVGVGGPSHDACAGGPIHLHLKLLLHLRLCTAVSLRASVPGIVTSLSASFFSLYCFSLL